MKKKNTTLCRHSLKIQLKNHRKAQRYPNTHIHDPLTSLDWSRHINKKKKVGENSLTGPKINHKY